MNQTFYIMASLTIAMLVVCVGLGIVTVYLEQRIEQMLDKLEDLKKQTKTKPVLTLKSKRESNPESLWDSVFEQGEVKEHGSNR